MNKCVWKKQHGAGRSAQLPEGLLRERQGHRAVQLRVFEAVGV